MPGYLTHITENLRIGVDFYGISVAQGAAAMSGSADSSASVIRIATASTSISITSNLLISSLEEQYERVDIHSYSSVTTVGEKIAYAQSNISIQTTTSIFSKKIAKSSTSIDSDLNISSSAIEIQKVNPIIYIDSNFSVSVMSLRAASSSISSDVQVTSSAHEILRASSAISGSLSCALVVKEINFASTSISIFNSNILINLIKFRTDGIIDTSNYQTLFVLDNSPLTNQGRTFSSDLSQVIIENKNWNNYKSRYYKRSGSSGRKTFTLAWTFLPDSRYDTIDKRHARDFLRKVASDPDVHVLKMINDDSDHTTPYTETTYNVFIKDYSETLIRRDLINDVYYWDCNLTLEEV